MDLTLIAPNDDDTDLLPSFGTALQSNSPCRVAPAMSAGVTDRAWDMNDVPALIAAQEAPVAKRGPYKQKAA